ncbi:hypothetical protein NM688_g2173 [Phlebia brevispora]|uniref:Uncharacterized protein n=1 Tax=Phlebia brevispora TaxID=194682 RepID=A0ACC1T9M6_9APHY|nr:hypothetical protein NM688_g2173 [Phlebia brevispora]
MLMATTAIVRNPLATKSHTQHVPTPGPSWQSTRKIPSAKRAHSPEPQADAQGNISKRAKAAPEAATTTTVLDRKARRVEKEQEFRDKYSRAFPNWVFYFDLDTVPSTVKDTLGKRVAQMGARVEEFFSREVTHFITQENVDKPANKENVIKSRSVQNTGGPSLESPIRLRTRASNNGLSELVQKAIAFDLKIWSAEKLESVLDRSEPVGRLANSAVTLASTTASSANAQAPALSYLLKAEKLTGTTERDPTQKRHDYAYFEKNSYFILVEDIWQELATIVAVQYPAKGRDGKDKVSYPVLYCHPLSRGPFVAYDEKEERRREKQERAEKEREQELRKRKLRILDFERRKKAELEAKRQGELRRTQSMSNLRRRATFGGQGTEGFVDLDADYMDPDVELPESAVASGYLASNAYVAASGNSVGITSTTGTTSAAGGPFRTQLPHLLREKLQHEVVTSRKLPNPITRLKENAMGPPPVPDRQRMLRKSRSTNTIRLPKRDEASKPGYCESCRQKFTDFKEHVNGRRHRKFAADDANFASLDSILARVKRRTLDEVRERHFYEDTPQGEDSYGDFAKDDDDAVMELPVQDWLDSDEEL